MDSFEFNKVLGALLGALTLLVGVMVFSDILFDDHVPETPGYIVEVPEEGTGEPEVAEFVTPLPVLLASASIEDGAAFVRACASCHNFGQGEPNKVGPGLYGIHDRQIAAVADFGYSEALSSRSDEPWSFENMDGFLADPRGWAPGTTMGYAGIRRDTDRANVLAYLNSLSDSPDVLPTAEEAAVLLAEAQAAFDAAQAGGEADGEATTDEAVEGDTSDASEVKVDGGDAETPTPEGEVKPVVTGEDIAVEANEDAAIVEDTDTDIAVPAPVIDSSAADGEGTGIETDAVAPVAEPVQQTTPTTETEAQPGTVVEPASEAVEAAPVEAAPAEVAPAEVTPTEAAPVEAAPVETAPVEAVPAPAATMTEPTPAPNVTTTTGEAQVEVERVGEPKVIIVPVE